MPSLAALAQELTREQARDAAREPSSAGRSTRTRSLRWCCGPSAGSSGPSASCSTACLAARVVRPAVLLLAGLLALVVAVARPARGAAGPAPRGAERVRGRPAVRTAGEHRAAAEALASAGALGRGGARAAARGRAGAGGARRARPPARAYGRRGRPRRRGGCGRTGPGPHAGRARFDEVWYGGRPGDRGAYEVLVEVDDRVRLARTAAPRVSSPVAGADRTPAPGPATTSAAPTGRALWRCAPGPLALAACSCSSSSSLHCSAPAAAAATLDPRSYAPGRFPRGGRAAGRPGVPVRVVGDLPQLRAELGPGSTVVVPLPPSSSTRSCGSSRSSTLPSWCWGRGGRGRSDSACRSATEPAEVRARRPACDLPAAARPAPPRAAGVGYRREPGVRLGRLLRHRRRRRPARRCPRSGSCCSAARSR